MNCIPFLQAYVINYETGKEYCRWIGQSYMWIVWIVVAIVLWVMWEKFLEWFQNIGTDGYNYGDDDCGKPGLPPCGKPPLEPINPVPPDNPKINRERDVQAMADAVIKRKSLKERNKVK